MIKTDGTPTIAWAEPTTTTKPASSKTQAKRLYLGSLYASPGYAATLSGGEA